MDVRIGITTSYQDHEHRLHRAYVQAVERAGALPLIVPVLERRDSVDALVTLIDGLLIPGGPAVTDGLLGTLPDDIAETDPVRVASDERLLDAVEAAGKPVLGICYGMQLLNARAGGTLYADVQHQVADAGVHSEKRGADVHPVRLAPGSRLHALLKADVMDVNTRHIQAIAVPGDGFRVNATAPDGTVEGIENEDGTLLGVQFHPERMGDVMLPLFRHLVEKARKIRAAAASTFLIPP